MSWRTRSVGKTALAIVVLAMLPCWYMWKLIHDAAVRDDLFSAIRANNAARAKALLKTGVDPNLRQTHSHRPGPIQLVERFLNPDQKVLEPTPLLAALYSVNHVPGGQTEIRYNPSPNPEIVGALLDKGADANATDDVRTTPLFFAVASGNTQVVDLLLKHGAQVNRTDMAGSPLLFTSAGQGRTEMMEYLLSHGSDVKERDALGETALIHTVRFARSPAAVKLLLNHHIDVNAKDKAKKTALFYARNPAPWLSASQTRLLPEVIAVLILAGAR